MSMWDTIKPELEEWIEAHESELSNLVMELVRYPSVGTGLQSEHRYPFGRECARLAKETQRVIERYGLAWQNHDYYAISATYGTPIKRAGSAESDEHPRIAFYSHLDVVPASSSGWSRPPFDPYIKDGWIYGRGSTDNKGPFSSVLFALRFLAEHDIRLKYDVTLFGGFDEEVGMDDAKWIAKNLEPSRFNLVSDCSFPVCIAEKGIFEIELTYHADDPALIHLKAGDAANAIPNTAYAEVVSGTIDAVRRYEADGKSAHAAFPEGSKNALVALAAQLADEKELAQKTRKQFAAIVDLFTCTDGSKAGISLNDDFLGSTTCVPTVARYKGGEIRILVNLRYPAIRSSSWILERFTHSANKAGFEVRSVHESPARSIHKDVSLIDLLTGIVHEETGSDLKPYAMGGATHARWIPDALGFGPGRQFDGIFPTEAGSGHEANEAVCIGHLKQAVKIYVRTILELDERYAP